MKNLLILICLFMIPAALFAWEKTYGGVLIDRGYSIRQLQDGNIVISGYTSTYGAGGGDVYLLKIDTNGNKLLEKTFGGGSYDLGASIQILPNNSGFVIGGTTSSFGNGAEDFLLLKTDNSFNTVFQKAFGGRSGEWCNSVSLVNDGGFILAGETISFGAGGRDIYVVRTDAQGNIIWAKTFGRTNDEYGRWAIQTDEGGFIIAGSTNSYGNGKHDCLLIKTDENGNIQWENVYGGFEHDVAISIHSLSDGYIICGEASNLGAGEGEMYLFKINKQGTLIFEKVFGGNSVDWGREAIQTNDGGFIACGATYSYGSGNQDMFIVKTDSNGNLQWQSVAGGENDDVAYSVIQTEDQHYAFIGYTESYGSGYADVYLYKTEKETGFSAQKIIPKKESASIATYPNPFRSNVNINYSIKEDGQIKLQIFDISGKLMKTLVDEKKQKGNYSLIWQANTDKKINGGVFFIKLSSNDRILATRKILQIE
ncbi:MAG: T9SS type A sorting domain-containing protein [Candidatus Coatesbacteria bacterium]|nr:T9SS type A sorting domain-containing protein [Candidatus Coatesbacteria bacterium]